MYWAQGKVKVRKLFIVPNEINVILAYHWSIKTYTGLPLVIQSVYWPIIGHLYYMTFLRPSDGENKIDFAQNKRIQ